MDEPRTIMIIIFIEETFSQKVVFGKDLKN